MRKAPSIRETKELETLLPGSSDLCGREVDALVALAVAWGVELDEGELRERFRDQLRKREGPMIPAARRRSR